MGNIRQLSIKNISHELLLRYPNEFSLKNFNQNKKKVSEFTNITSKLIINRVAGYITKLLSSNKKKRKGEDRWIQKITN